MVCGKYIAPFNINYAKPYSSACKRRYSCCRIEKKWNRLNQRKIQYVPCSSARGAAMDKATSAKTRIMLRIFAVGRWVDFCPLKWVEVSANATAAKWWDAVRCTYLYPWMSHAQQTQVEACAARAHRKQCFIGVLMVHAKGKREWQWGYGQEIWYHLNYLRDTSSNGVKHPLYCVGQYSEFKYTCVLKLKCFSWLFKGWLYLRISYIYIIIMQINI